MRRAHPAGWAPPRYRDALPYDQEQKALVTLATLSTPDKPLRNFEEDDQVLRPRHPDQVDWRRRLHLKVVYETIYFWCLVKKTRRIRSVRTFASLTGTCPSQAWRHIEALVEMGLLDLDRGTCSAHHGHGEASEVWLCSFADVEHLPSVRDLSTSDPYDIEYQQPMFHMRELDPWASDNELWAPSGLGSHGREVALAGLRTGPASINAIAAEAGVSWHAAANALRKMEHLGMAHQDNDGWTVIEEAIVREVTTQQYDGAVTTAQNLHHAGRSEDAMAVVTALAYCRVVSNESHQPRRRRYVTLVRHQRREYKEGPSRQWIRRTPSDRWSRLDLTRSKQSDSVLAYLPVRGQGETGEDK